MIETSSIQCLWGQGRHQVAIDQLRARLNRESPAGQRPLLLQLAGYVRQLGDQAGAERLLLLARWSAWPPRAPRLGAGVAGQLLVNRSSPSAWL